MDFAASSACDVSSSAVSQPRVQKMHAKLIGHFKAVHDPILFGSIPRLNASKCASRDSVCCKYNCMMCDDAGKITLPMHKRFNSAVAQRLRLARALPCRANSDVAYLLACRSEVDHYDGG
eukprot:4425083-Pyramimonas_sp.AAC.1